MRSFFLVLFCGLGLVFGGILIIWSLDRIWESERPAVNIDGTINDGLSRLIRYTANEEEDVINSALGSLPQGEDRITASSYIVKNLTKGTVWTEYDSDRIKPIASVAKLVTAVVARKLIPEDAEIGISAAIVNTFGNTAGFKEGESFAASDLTYPLLMVSSNDAAEAFARKFGRKLFVKAMNDFVQSIGAYKTYFSDPSGLSRNDVSSAGDLALILDWIRQNDPGILEITLTKAKTVRNHAWVNPTHFLSWSYYAGGKNGFIDEAGRTTAALFRLGYEKDVYAIVVLGSDNRDADVVRLINKVK